MPDHHHHHHHHHWRDRDRSGYAYHAGEPGPGPNMHRLRRNVRDRKIAGVCAGVADYFGWDRGVLRAGWALAAIFFFPVPIFIYLLAAVVIKPAHEPAPAYRSPEEERFWRTFSVKPKATFQELKHRFRALDARISDMERAVTSDEYGLRKAFRDLERGA
ncbi:MAG: PspC domain-containing protein [Pseudomonadota bacterium]